MDIENMHPFCLPFSLCHDATSSSITDDSYGSKQTKQNDLERSNNNDDKFRLKGGSVSPVDDSPNRQDSSNLSNHSMIDEDHFIGSSIGGCPHDAFDLLELDMEMRTDDEFELRDVDTDDICNKNDDWFSISSNHDCLLFSPADNSISTSALHYKPSLKSQLKDPPAYSTFSSYSPQVFQHIVDPIDIKSSPTLAQLNLNSNDDPSDGIWDATSATTTTSTTSTLISSTAHHHHQHQHHLNSPSNSDLLTSAPNCSSSTGATTVVTGCSGGNHFLSSCNHLNHIYNQRLSIASTESAARYSVHPNNSHLHSCQQHSHHHHQNQHEHQQNNSPTHAHSTCLAVTPFSKNTVQNQRSNLMLPAHQGCCLNHSHHQHLDRFSNISPNISAQSSTTCSLDQKTQSSNRFQAPHHFGVNGEAHSIKQQLNVTEKNHGCVQRQRCQSPAPLVTSSSSPLSCSALQNQVGGDNKLKENIEYLTVLLCNGSKKLDNKASQQQHSQQELQQSTISSSMVKSYSTLAQSLSAGPKLLERYHQNEHSQQIHHQPVGSFSSNNAQQNVSSNQTNTMATGAVVPHCANPNDSQLSDLPGSKRICSNHCFKPAGVESSISAADSTAERQLTHSIIDHSKNSRYMGQSVTNISSPLEASRTHVSRSSDMKVLSSLLSSNKCVGQASAEPMVGVTITNVDNYNQQQQAPCITWSSPCGQNVSQHNQPMTNVNNNNNNSSYPCESITNGHNVTYGSHDQSIPINGRPITLTPLVSNNVIIPQRQPAASQQINSKSKTPTFIQPASPSTSSTTSSSGNTDAAPQSSVLPKKQRSGTNSAGKNNNQSERSARPNSMSTDCSLSSHDEGFSSQIDQDDCGNSVRGESDDESDIDSDDESFYGDYTNNDLIGASISDNPECKWTLNMGRTRRNGQKRFFWQYNVQSKGPKGTRVCAADGAEDPFVFPEASDPVFSNECQVEGVKHSGKARRGDGNDLTPNPRKLLMIGLELKKLSKIINELAPVTDLPINARNKTRKEKNKLASRACRLKKKAQHEANKIKLYGLQREHQQVVMAIFDARKMIQKSLTQQASIDCSDSGNQLSTNLRNLLDQCLMTVAGQTGDYVNSVLEKVVSGCIDGGLQT